MCVQLSPYAGEQFVKFLKNKDIQETINDMVVFMNVTDIDEIVNVCLTMFLVNVDMNLLYPNDLEILKSQIREIRAMSINVWYDGNAVPDKVRDTMQYRLREYLAKEGK